MTAYSMWNYWKFFLFLAFLSFTSRTSFSQIISIKGWIQDSESSESLIGVNVYAVDLNIGTASNQFGYFHLNLPVKDSVKVTFSYLGYAQQTVQLKASSDTVINIALRQEGQVLNEIEITDTYEEENIQDFNKAALNIEKIKQLPLLAGEVDILRMFQLLPGVQGGKEGSSSLHVRGGSPDQNLILLDGVPLYYVNHLGGFFSIFDPNAVKQVTLYKGGFPARYGGRLSSILDVRMKEGNKQRRGMVFDLGLLSTRIGFETPIKQNTSSFFVSLRRCNLDLISRITSRLKSNGLFSGGYTFYDINTKYHHKFSTKDQIFISFYGGMDYLFVRQQDADPLGKNNFLYKGRSNLQWGNTLGAFRWTHVYHSNLFSNLTLAFTKFHYTNSVKGQRLESSSGDVLEERITNFRSGVRDLTMKIDLEYYPTSHHNIRFGGMLTNHLFNPGVFTLAQHGNEIASKTSMYGSTLQRAIEMNAYAEDQITFNIPFETNIGMHSATYIVGGKHYTSIQPRITGTYHLKKIFAWNISFSRMTQFLHLLSNTGSGIPVDLWVPATERVKPQQASLITTGISASLSSNKDYLLQIEGYHKLVKNLIEFEQGASFFGKAGDWQDKVALNGKGRINGLEFIIEKKKGKSTGWLAYTISKNDRKFASLNNGNYFPYRYDRRHEISIVVNHQINTHANFSLTWIYNTGNAITLAERKFLLYTFEEQSDKASTHYYEFGYSEGQIYSSRNGYRMPAYHRLDLGFNFTKEKTNWIRTFRIGIYNLYNRKNPYYLYFDQDKTGRWKLFQVSLLPFLPSFSWTWQLK